MASGFNPTPSTSGLAAHAGGLPAEWKWAALFVPPAGFEPEWRAWLAQAQKDYADGVQFAARGRDDQAAESFASAWKKSQDALKKA